MFRNGIIVFCLIAYNVGCFAQEEGLSHELNNQVSTNISYLVLGSINMSYERTLSKYFTVGLSGVNYGKAHKKLYLNTNGNGYSTTYEINPFARWYMRNTSRNSHFLEVFGSYNQSQDDNKVVRITNEQGYGVYTYGVKTQEHFGAGVGFGYRLLLAEKKLVLEAQFGLRTNFEVDYFFFNAEIARTGLRIGYRF